MTEGSPLNGVFNFLRLALGLTRIEQYPGSQIIPQTPIYNVPQFPPGDQSSGQGSGQGVGSGVNDDNPFGNWDGTNNAANLGGIPGFQDANNNGIPDDIDALLGGR